MAAAANFMTAPAVPVRPLVGTVAAGVALGLFEYAIACGADPAELAREALCGPGDFADLDRRISLTAYVRLTMAAKRLTGLSALSLRFGAEVPLTQISAMAYAAAAPADPSDTVALLNAFGRLAADVGPVDGQRFALEQRGDAMWLHDRRPGADTFPDLTESTFARMVAGARRRGIADPVKALTVTHTRPPHHRDYDAVFGAPTTFNATANAMLIDPAMLSTPAPLEDTYAARTMEAHARTLRHQLSRKSGTRGLIVAELDREAVFEIISIAGMAGRLRVSPRTLARRLQAEGTTFDRIMDDLRCERALKHLVVEGRSIDETTRLVGFSDRAAFARAFKRWTGRSPGTVVRREASPAPANKG